MAKKFLFLVITILLVILFLAYWFAKTRQPNFPKIPTVAEREEAKKLPREKCSCWDGRDGFCHPIQDCI